MAKTDYRRYGMKAVAGGIISYIIASLVARQINGIRKTAGLPHVHHYQIGMAAIPPALLNTNKDWSGYVAGAGAGLIIHDAADTWKMFKGAYAPRSTRDLADVYDLSDYLSEVDEFEDDLGDDTPTIRKITIPDFPPRAKYKAIANIIRDEIRNGAEDELVRRTAVGIMHENNLEGRDEVGILKAFQKFSQNKLRYVYDPRIRDSKGGSFERIASASRTLKDRSGDCDCLTVEYLARAKSVGLSNVHAALVDQRGRGYNHILPIYVPKGRRLTYDDAIGIELTRKVPWGYKPKRIKAGIINCDHV